MGFLNNWVGKYQIEKLLHCRKSVVANGELLDFCTICDLDKTYYESTFATILDLARTAMQTAAVKQTVPGANFLLQAMRWPNESDGLVRGLHFISSSPPQLRATIQEKLQMDGLFWEGVTLKDQLYNIKQGRTDQLRDHVGYKVLAVARVLQQVKSGGTILLIGDAAEYDTLVYTLIKCYLSEKISAPYFAKLLKASNIHPDSVKQIVALLSSCPRNLRQLTFIRSLHDYERVGVAPLTNHIFNFDHFGQVGVILCHQGLLTPRSLVEVLRHCRDRFLIGKAEFLRSLTANWLAQSTVDQEETEAFWNPLLRKLGYSDSEIHSELSWMAQVQNYPPKIMEQVMGETSELLASVADLYRGLSRKRFGA